MSARPTCFRLVLLCLMLSGCASYSGYVNRHAPASQTSAVTVGRGGAEMVLSGTSPFCYVPPPPIKEVYMVMPEEGGRVGTVDVTFNDGSSLVLHGAYSAATLAGDTPTAFTADAAQMKAYFGDAVAALPMAPTEAILYFVLGKDILTPESRAQAERVYADLSKRQAPEITVTGHTDTVGGTAFNEKLSVRRAEKVRQSLIGYGVPAENIQVYGLGESSLLVPTPDNTQEPRNRRVEVRVR